MRFREKAEPYIYILPQAVLFIAFILIPIIGALQISFFEWGLLSPEKTFVGLKNFIELLTDDEYFWQYLKNTLYFAILTVPLLTVLSFLFATSLVDPIFGDNLFQFCIFVPLTVSVSSAGIVMKWIFNPIGGIFNKMLSTIGIAQQQWLNSNELAMIVVALTFIWMRVGFTTIILIAALREVPASYYESASIDGANAFEKFFFITLPSIKHALLFILSIMTIESFNAFGHVYVVTQGGPGDATRVLTYYLYLSAFRFFKMGKASAIGIFLFCIVGTIIFVQFKFLSQKD